MEFYHDYSKCSICGSKMIKYKLSDGSMSDGFKFKCPNECCMHELNITSETVVTFLFGEEWDSYFLPLYRSTYDNAGNTFLDVYKIDYRKFIEKIEYWKENDRYLVELLTR